MRKEMREKEKKAEMIEMLSERNDKADQLFEKWCKRSEVGKGLDKLYEADVVKGRATALILENQEAHLSKLTETQISNSFSTTPENVLRVVRLGYPNSVRGELFLEWAMETARDSIYYLSPVYASSKRGAIQGDIFHESASFRYASEIEEDVIGSGDGSTTTFGTTLANTPIRPYTVRLYLDNAPYAVDDGNGNIIGDLLDTSLENSVDYNTGAVVLNFETPPASGVEITVQSNYDSEVASNYDEIGSIELQLRDYQFRVKPWPLYVSWSKMTELLLNTTLNIDAEDALIRGAADELKKALDFHAVRTAYKASLRNTIVNFDIQGAVGESEVHRAMAFNRAIDGAADAMYNQLQRGGVTKLVGGPSAVSYVKLHQRFDGSNRQPRVGIYREGSLDGIDIYKAPASIVPNNEFMAIYKNEEVPEDVSVAFGTLIPLYKTMSLEYKEMYTENGIAFFGDSKVLQPKYLQRIGLQNL